MTEPIPPAVSTLAHRLFGRLPEVYRRLDGGQDWLLKRYINAVTYMAGDIEDVIERIRGSRPAGPDAPLPWGLVSDEELTRWIQARTTATSHLGDPQQADPAWLPWLASMVGAYLDPAATLPEQRDTIQYATSGWRAGTAGAIADAARSALEGSRFVKVLRHTRVVSAALEGGTMWDITIVTRASETPDPDAVLGAVLRKGVKPAGAVLYAHTYSAGWDIIEALYPTWEQDWEQVSWEQIEEAGLTYADVPDNLAPNPSFEDGATAWTAGGGAAITQQTGGLDGTHVGRLTSGNAATVADVHTTALIAAINDERSYHFSVSVRPHIALTGATLEVDWFDVSSVLLSTTSVALDTSSGVGQWTRSSSVHLAPVGATQARLRVELGNVAVAEYADLDAILFRLI